MEALAILAFGWFAFKRVMVYSLNPVISLPANNTVGDGIEPLVINKEIKGRGISASGFEDITDHFDVNIMRPIDPDQELADVYYPYFARDELKQPRVRQVWEPMDEAFLRQRYTPNP